MGMIEEIGKVKLDYSKYSGRDQYCDGAVEDELLNLVRNKTSAEYGKIIEEKKSWPILYHLSPLRENIVDWIPMEGTYPMGSSGAVGDASGLLTGAKVLEVGSGCGAITGALSRKAASVTCVELSKKRSQINAYRHRECDNVTIHVGNFKDIEPELEADFDYICLIGVFEYAQSYMGGDTPYEDFLKILLSHLAPEGRLLIAIENKFGLKYFAGCKEDHLGTYFSGIENYASGGGVRTFSRQGLERIFQACGVEEWHFYYPYPDYKFMTMLYSDEYLPNKGELSNNLRNFDRDRMLLFDEKLAFDGLMEDGLFSVFSNSYLAVIGRDFEQKYVKYSNDRAPEYAVRTEIISRFWHRQRLVSVRKYPMSEAAADHVRGMVTAYESLTEKYQGGNLEINRCELVDDGNIVFAQFEFVPGVPLSELMDKCLEKNDLEGFYRYFREYVERIGYNSEYPASDFDLTFSNILVQKGVMEFDGEASQEQLFQEQLVLEQLVLEQSFREELFLEQLRKEDLPVDRRETKMEGMLSDQGGSAFQNGTSAQRVNPAANSASDLNPAVALNGASASDPSVMEQSFQGEAGGKEQPFSRGAAASGRERRRFSDRWTLIDYEWTFGKAIETKELAYRAIYCYLLENSERSRLKPERILKELSITEDTAELYRQQEREFQRFVTGERAAMAEIREKIGCKAIVPQKWIEKYQNSEQVNRVQIYEDKGAGFREEDSYFVQDAYQGDHLIELKLKVSEDVKMLRIDPGLCPCVVKFREVTWNGEIMPLEKRKLFSVNGRIVKPVEKAGGYYPCVVFATNDPNMTFTLGGLEHSMTRGSAMENTLRVRMDIVQLPLSVAQDLAESRSGRLF